MAGFSNYSALAFGDWSSGKTAMPAVTTRYLALLTAVTANGGGVTEASFTGYARVPVPAADWNSTSGTDPSTTVTNATASFAASTQSTSQTVVAWALYDAATGGNLIRGDWLGNCPWFPFTATLASPGVITAPGITAGSTPNLADGSLVIVDAGYGGALPGGLVNATQYTVAGLASDSFNVGVDTTTAGSGMVRQIVPMVISYNTAVNFAAGALTLTQI